MWEVETFLSPSCLQRSCEERSTRACARARHFFPRNSSGDKKATGGVTTSANEGPDVRGGEAATSRPLRSVSGVTRRSAGTSKLTEQ